MNIDILGIQTVQQVSKIPQPQSGRSCSVQTNEGCRRGYVVPEGSRSNSKGHVFVPEGIPGKHIARGASTNIPTTNRDSIRVNSDRLRDRQYLLKPNWFSNSVQQETKKHQPQSGRSCEVQTHDGCRRGYDVSEAVANRKNKCLIGKCWDKRCRTEAQIQPTLPGVFKLI